MRSRLCLIILGYRAWWVGGHDRSLRQPVYRVCNQQAKGDEWWQWLSVTYLSFFFLFFMVLPGHWPIEYSQKHLWWILTSTNLITKIAHRYTHIFVSIVIPSSIKLTIKIICHNFDACLLVYLFQDITTIVLRKYWNKKVYFLFDLPNWNICFVFSKLSLHWL